MKKMIIAFILLFVFSLCAQQVEQNQPSENESSKEIKMLTSEQEEEVKVEIRKPDDSSLMPRKETDFEKIRIEEIRKKIKKSNKMLYKKR